MAKDDDNYKWLDEYSANPLSAQPSPNPDLQVDRAGTSAPPPDPTAARGSAAPEPPPLFGRSGMPPATGSRDRKSPDELAAKLRETQPTVPLRSRFEHWNGKVVVPVVVGVVALIVLANFVLPETAKIRGLDVGDCFEAPEGSFQRVTIQDCTLPHGGEVLAEANGVKSDVDEKCTDAFRDIDAARLETLPADAEFTAFTAVISHRCVVISPSGQLIDLISEPER